MNIKRRQSQLKKSLILKMERSNLLWLKNQRLKRWLRNLKLRNNQELTGLKDLTLVDQMRPSILLN
jgi:hypothetical protein